MKFEEENVRQKWMQVAVSTKTINKSLYRNHMRGLYP